MGEAGIHSWLEEGFSSLRADGGWRCPGQEPGRRRTLSDTMRTTVGLDILLAGGLVNVTSEAGGDATSRGPSSRGVSS